MSKDVAVPLRNESEASECYRFRSAKIDEDAISVDRKAYVRCCKRRKYRVGVNNCQTSSRIPNHFLYRCGKFFVRLKLRRWSLNGIHRSHEFNIARVTKRGRHDTDKPANERSTLVHQWCGQTSSCPVTRIQTCLQKTLCITCLPILPILRSLDGRQMWRRPLKILHSTLTPPQRPATVPHLLVRCSAVPA